MDYSSLQEVKTRVEELHTEGASLLAQIEFRQNTDNSRPVLDACAHYLDSCTLPYFADDENLPDLIKDAAACEQELKWTERFYQEITALLNA